MATVAAVARVGAGKTHCGESDQSVCSIPSGLGDGDDDVVAKGDIVVINTTVVTFILRSVGCCPTPLAVHSRLRSNTICRAAGQLLRRTCGGVVVHELYQETREPPVNEGNSLDWFGLGYLDMRHPVGYVLRCLQFNWAATAACFGSPVPPPERSGRVAKTQAQGIAGGNCAC